MALKQIKNKIISTQKTGKVTKAMEAVSAVKMRKTQEQALQSRPYVRTAMQMLRHVAVSREAKDHPFLMRREEGTTLLVVVTSDKGLAGSVNSAVLKLAEEYVAANPNTEIIAIGKKAADFAQFAGITVRETFTNFGDDVATEDVFDITRIATDAFSREEYADVFVLYQNFVSTFEQNPVMRRILPLTPEELEAVMRDIRPQKGKYSDDEALESKDVSYEIEPSAESVLTALIPQLVQILLYHALVESKASEHSARMVAMKSATDKTKEVTRALTLEYNKERQSEITAEVSEITGGIEAMK